MRCMYKECMLCLWYVVCVCHVNSVCDIIMSVHGTFVCGNVCGVGYVCGR